MTDLARRPPHTAGTPLYSAEQLRRADAAIIESGIEGYALMNRAADAALRALRARWPVARDLLVLCGGGHNGGDGYVLARLAQQAGLAVRVLAVSDVARLRGDTARAAAECRSAGVALAHDAAVELDPAALDALCEREFARCDVLVDAIFGIGLNAEVGGPVARIIALLGGGPVVGAARRPAVGAARLPGVGAARRPVVALDIPSGLCASTGRVRGVAVRADLTVTFIAQKLGLFVGEGPALAGEVLLDPLGTAESLIARGAGAPRLRVLGANALRASLARRARAAHKGDAGHVLVIGGGVGMPGAARLASESALRAGAGRVSVLCAEAAVVPVAAGCAELMVRAIGSLADLAARVAAADALAIGPGLGTGDWARAVVRAALAAAHQAGRPTVIDADALNILAANAGAEALVGALPEHCVLTPHPGEAARLLGCDSATVQADRLSALRALQVRYSATIVLKGAGSLISGDLPQDPPWLCPAGNPAMAAPGMGDVLTGVVAALLGQGVLPPAAARLAVLWHAMAGDAAAVSAAGAAGEGAVWAMDRGVLASEVSAQLPQIAARGLA